MGTAKDMADPRARSLFVGTPRHESARERLREGVKVRTAMDLERMCCYTLLPSESQMSKLILMDPKNAEFF